MSKRFTDTEKWKHKWFTDLAPTQKLLWTMMCDECDGAGIWPINLGRASYQIGATVTESDLGAIGWNTHIVRISDDKLWLTGFIKFQYKNLSPKNKAQLGIMRAVVNAVSALPSFSFDVESRQLVEQFKLTLNRGSTGGHLTLLDTVTVTDMVLKEGGMGEEGLVGKQEPTKKDDGAHEQLLAIWNTHRGDLPGAMGLGVGREKHAKARWSEHPSPDFWIEVVQRMAKSDFLTRRKPSETNPHFIADIDFMLRADKLLKILEGSYDNRGPAKRKQLTVDL